MKKRDVVTNESRKKTYNDFIQRWPIQKIKDMTIEEYVSLNKKDTFCQWVENRTVELGSIKGSYSNMFGIYMRAKREKHKRLIDDELYSWRGKYGNTREKAFDSIKKDILEVINYSMTNHYEKIDDIPLHSFFKWKIASLYSNERLIPIFTIKVLKRAMKTYGLKNIDKMKISEMHLKMIENKPLNMSIYEYMDYIYDYSDRGKRSYWKGKRRGASKSIKINNQIRKVNYSVEIEQKHKEMQNEIAAKLIKKYGEAFVYIEEDYIDIFIKGLKINTYIEIKTSSYALDCLKEGLIQLMIYLYVKKEKGEKRVVIIGPNPVTSEERKCMKYLNDSFQDKFIYLSYQEAMDSELL